MIAFLSQITIFKVCGKVRNFKWKIFFKFCGLLRISELYMLPKILSKQKLLLDSFTRFLKMRDIISVCNKIYTAVISQVGFLTSLYQQDSNSAQ